ncbi:hypothetical protein GCM10022254_33270 [Actinomadura meridiana]|uniref:LysM domain-containing protein n=1 Tax=Actinomadura meridiana TaxID=559626 RepID=A0ABP8C339_9ACTN
MTEASIDQIEYRWDSGDDLTGIARSFGSVEFDRWNGLLRPYTGVSGRGRSAAADAPSSAVYLTQPDGMAALILRSRDPAARPLYDRDAPRAHGAGEGRLDLVARALVAPCTLLTAEIAMRIVVSHPQGLLDPIPGQAARGMLPRLPWQKLQANINPAHTLERPAKLAAGLAPVIAAVLAAPARPLMVVIGPEEIRRAAWQSRALPLLWASRLLLEPLLRDPDDGRELFGWRPSFSTCEAPLSSGDGREGLWLTFRERGPDGPPLGEGPMVVDLGRPVARQTVFEDAANRLAEAYAADGEECVSLVERAVRGHRTLEARIEAVACSEEIARVLSTQAPAVTMRRTPAPRQVPAAPVPVAEPVPAVGVHRPTAPPLETAPPVHTVPPVPEPVAPRPESGAPGADPYLVGLYHRLETTRDPRIFRRQVAWIAARAASGGGLDPDGFTTVLRIMEQHRWFTDPVRELDDPAERMADLIHALFTCVAGEGRLEERLEAWHANGPPSALVADALAVLAGRLEPGRADWLAHHCLRQRQPVARAAQGAVLLTLVRLPATWPAVVVGPLVWLSLVLLPVVVYLLLT